MVKRKSMDPRQISFVSRLLRRLCLYLTRRAQLWKTSDTNFAESSTDRDTIRSTIRRNSIVVDIVFQVPPFCTHGFSRLFLWWFRSVRACLLIHAVASRRSLFRVAIMIVRSVSKVRPSGY